MRLIPFFCLTALTLLSQNDGSSAAGKARGDGGGGVDRQGESPSPRGRSLRFARAKDEGVCELEISCKNNDVDPLRPVKLPIRGPRGPPGHPGQKGDSGEDGAPGIPGLSGLSASVPRRVAFFVGLSGNIGPVTEHTDIRFDRILTNIGSAYDQNNGRFTSPINATYQFNIVIAAQGRQKAGVMLVKNGAMVETVWAESIPYWASASNVAILSLERDDQVWLLLLNRAPYLHGYMYSTFSGFLIFEN